MSKQDVLVNDETMHHDHRQWESDVSMWDAHERMKKHHHTVMAHIAMLKATLDSSL
ncbi:hypothetical protein [Rhodopirellula bahusiensis]|uniref:hypothetical protein n=1 Tax=Rhodopirellula bahusiensis TaxID=2014065 RepID=UPI0018EC9BEB|nr:hypothetical protein [Rhodopirellula bahusiensis]